MKRYQDYVYKPLRTFLKRKEMDAKGSKDGASLFDARHTYYKLDTGKENFKEVRDLIVEAVEHRFTGGFLNEKAPAVSRLFLDIDVNKIKKDCPPGPTITSMDMVSFMKSLNRIINEMRLKEPDVERILSFPDFSSQIIVDGSDFQWYCHPDAEKEL